MQRHIWSKLNKQQVGAFTEYIVKMELTMYGFQVYGTEVDDRGIDFIAANTMPVFRPYANSHAGTAIEDVLLRRLLAPHGYSCYTPLREEYTYRYVNCNEYQRRNAIGSPEIVCC